MAGVERQKPRDRGGRRTGAKSAKPPVARNLTDSTMNRRASTD